MRSPDGGMEAMAELGADLTFTSSAQQCGFRKGKKDAAEFGRRRLMMEGRDGGGKGMGEGLGAVALPQPGGSRAELGRAAARRSRYRKGEWDRAPGTLQRVKTRVSEDREVKQLRSDKRVWGCGPSESSRPCTRDTCCKDNTCCGDSTCCRDNTLLGKLWAGCGEGGLQVPRAGS